MDVAANPSLWQATPRCHFGYGVYRVLYDQPLTPFLTHEVYDSSHMFNLPILPWAAPAVRCGEGFVKIDVDDVEAEVAGAGFADNGV